MSFHTHGRALSALPDTPAAPCCAAMQWGEGNSWVLESDIAGGSYDFKFVVQHEGATSDESEWEAGANRSVFVRLLTSPKP